VSSEKLTSIVILGFNEVEYTKLCIDSIFKYTNRPFELVLVDNGSSDGTGEYFDSIPGAKVIKNKENLGFAKGCNQGIEASSGEYILLLNNDTIVTENWLDNMIACMESDPRIGLVGPMSNFVAGPQQIEVPYGDSIEEMYKFAQKFNHRDPSKYIEADILIGFCLLVNRSVVDIIGLLDERYGLGNFEDNDYCVRVKMAGFKLIRAEDTFIHHFGSRTFIGNSIDWRGLMDENSKVFNEKWGIDDKPTQHELVMAKASLAALRDAVADSDPVRVYQERYMQKQWNVPDKYIGSPTLSLAMIVKDEEDNIARCLGSVKDIVSEIIVVDTGSTDRTVEIAKSYGAKVFFHKWSGDFAEARNVSLDHATGDWVMFLDADEELVVEDIQRLSELLVDTECEGFYFNEISFIGERAGEGSIVNVAFRLWRNKPEYRFSGAIHEQIIATVQSHNPNIGFSAVRINHYGYLNKSTVDKDKIKRNLGILLKEIEKKPEDSFTRFNLGVEYLRLSDYEKALEQYKKAFANLTGLDAAYASILVRNIALCLKELGRYQESLKVLKDAKEAYPDYTDLFYLEGLIHMDKKDFLLAADNFKACLRMGEAAKAYISQTGVGGSMAAFQLATCYKAIGNEKAAVDTYREALEKDSTNCTLLTHLGLLLVRREDPQRLKHFLESLVDLTSEDVLFTLSFIFNQGGYYEISFAYLSMIKGNGSNPSKLSLLRGECLLNLRRYGDAIEDLEAVSESSRFYPMACADKAICNLLLKNYDEARRSIDLIKDIDNYGLIHRVYKSLISLLGDDLVTLSINKEQSDEAKRVVADLLRSFLELEEFETFEEAIKLLNHLDFTSGEVDLFLGKVYYDVGYAEIAVETLIKAYENGYADGESFYILGRMAFSNGFYEEAKTFYLEAINNGIEEFQLYISLARALIKLGDNEQAFEILDAGANKYPDSPLIAEIRQSIKALV